MADMGLEEADDELEASLYRKRFAMESLRYTAHAGSHLTGHAPSNLAMGVKAGWRTGHSSEWLLLRLEKKALVSHLHLGNGGASKMEVWVAMHDKPRQYIRVKTLERLPHGKPVVVPLGHLPCQFVRVMFLQGAPIGLTRLDIRGVPASAIGRTAGRTLSRLVYR
jgi:hypothetical protein